MKNKLLRAKIGMFVAIFALFVSVFAYFSLDGSVAWFSSNKEANANGMQVTIQDLEPDEVQITVHQVIGTTDTEIYFNATEDPNNKKIPEYTLMGGAEHKVMIRIHCTKGKHSGLNLTATTETNYFMGQENSKQTNHWLLGGDGIGANQTDPKDYDNALSSIISITVIDTEANDNSIVNWSAAYEGTNSYSIPKELQSGQYETFRFAQIDEANPKAPVTINQSLALLTEASREDICLIVEYDPALIARVFSENIGNPVLEGADMEDRIIYLMDFKFNLFK